MHCDLADGTKADESKGYIAWAIDHDFGVIDVNIPEHITEENDFGAHTIADSDQAKKQAEKLAAYLWENYIEPNDNEQIFFVGVGNAFHGLVRLLCDRGASETSFCSATGVDSATEEVYQRVGGVVVFIAGNPVRPIHSTENPGLKKWYVEASAVYVAHTHSMWAVDRKQSKSYGKVYKSSGSMLHQMMLLHREEVFAFIGEKANLDTMKNEESEEEKMLRSKDIIMSLET